MENKQTAVEWLKSQLESYGSPQFCKLNWDELDELVAQAEEMEKDRLLHSFYAGGGVADDEDFEKQFEQYYEETYGTDESIEKNPNQEASN